MFSKIRKSALREIFYFHDSNPIQLMLPIQRKFILGTKNSVWRRLRRAKKKRTKNKIDRRYFWSKHKGEKQLMLTKKLNKNAARECRRVTIRFCNHIWAHNRKLILKLRCVIAPPRNRLGSSRSVNIFVRHKIDSIGCNRSL